MAFPALAAMGGAGGASAAGGAGASGGMGGMFKGMMGSGGMGSGGMFTNLAQKIMQHNAEREQRALQSASNADMMQYSPWTKLATQAATAQQENMKWVPGKALGQDVSETLGFAQKQDAANKQAANEDQERGLWQKILKKKYGIEDDPAPEQGMIVDGNFGRISNYA